MREELYLITAIAGRAVAMPSHCVDSVVDLGPVVPVPAAPPHVRGLAALRSKVVTVIDAAIALGEPDAALAVGRAVVVTVTGHVYAVLVDRLEDVAPFASSRLPDGVNLDAGWSKAARGVIDRGGEAVLIIDPAALIAGTGKAAEMLAA
ncbi:chemotaxis protein CheW [Sphingomonas gilva]|uniref:Chemotaxis protein CheW n=1 Tax=Sphingomonas gilva TaxID=2305907 RepID=A0A396RQE4_9SPHN|nr:chemotaxis protein CheW [Sphingomonas gilva]RHW16493.1 chemotaxis protein CheW [Sphingomonas gilva]